MPIIEGLASTKLKRPVVIPDIVSIAFVSYTITERTGALKLALNSTPEEGRSEEVELQVTDGSCQGIRRVTLSAEEAKRPQGFSANVEVFAFRCDDAFSQFDLVDDAPLGRSERARAYLDLAIQLGFVDESLAPGPAV